MICINFKGKVIILNENHLSCIDLVPMFKNLSYDEKKEIAFISKSKHYQKGETIYNQGSFSNDLYIVHKGQVKISRVNRDGKEQVIRTLEPGTFMGELSIFLEDVHSDSATVLEDCEICQLNGAAFKGLLSEIPSISLKLLKEMSKRLDETEDTVESIGTLDVEGRLAQKLLDLAQDQKQFTLPYAKKDMASLLGMSNETLSRKLREFEDLGYINLKGQRHISIVDKEKLEALI